MAQEPLSVARAKSLLERAAATGHLPAVYLLVDLLDREGATVRAIELLQRQLEGTSTATLHQLLADLLAKGGQEERAIQHYTQALALDPKNEVRMMNGLQILRTTRRMLRQLIKISKISSMIVKNPYEMITYLTKL